MGDRDVRMVEGVLYLPADTMTTLTGMSFDRDDAASMFTVHLPQAE